MEFLMLGPVEVIDTSDDLSGNILPSAPKTRQVLAMLALRRNTIVQTGELIDELWENDPPVSAMTTLQTYVYKLRKTLTGHGAEDVLATRSGGYSLVIPETSLDIHDFERKSDLGRTLLESGDASAAAEMLREALVVWRGPALADVIQGRLLSSYATGLEELRARALEMRIEADLQLGRHRELVSDLKQLVLTDPLNESLHASLMTALHHSGRRHEALEVYQGLRGNMVKELGLEPGQHLRNLHQAMLADSLPDLPATRQVARTGPQQLVPAPREPEPAPAEVAAPAEPEPAAVTVPAQLPPDIADFIGHARTLRETRLRLGPVNGAEARSSAMRTLVITGMPGVGKTTIAVHIAHQLSPQLEHGQLYACLGGSSNRPKDPNAVLHEFLQALGVPERRIPVSREERSNLFRSMAAQRRLLVVLDDVLPTSDVQGLLPGGPACVGIITARHRLYSLSGAWHVELDVPPPEEAAEMFGHIIGRCRLEQERSAAEELAAMYGHLPLALRCLGMRLARQPGFALASMVRDLKRARWPLAELRVGDLDVCSRYDALYDNLSRLEQATFRLLGMLPDHRFTAGQVAELLGWDEPSARRVIERLVDHHLVAIARGGDDGVRYSLPKVSSLYARGRLMSLLARGRTRRALDEEIFDAFIDQTAS